MSKLTQPLIDSCHQAVSSVPQHDNVCMNCRKRDEHFAAGLAAAITAVYDYCYAYDSDSPRRDGAIADGLAAFVRRVNAA